MSFAPKSTQVVVWMLPLLIAYALVRPLVPGGDALSGRSPEAFWRDKFRASASYDIVLAGDSRVYRGISPSRMEQHLARTRILNFGFSAAAFEPEYLNRLHTLLQPDGRGIIVLAVSPYSLTPTAAGSNGYLDLAAEPPSASWLFPAGMGRFEPLTMADLAAMAGRRPAFVYQQAYNPDGWVESDQEPRDQRRALEPYREMFRDNHVSQELVAGLLRSVRSWREAGLIVVGLRMPIGRELQELEEELSGMDWTAFLYDFTSVGGLWLTSTETGGPYESYDGSHLTGQAAQRFSDDLAIALRVELDVLD